MTELIPSRTDALAVTWIDFGSALQLETGQGPGGRWELVERDDQASEVFGTSRSRVEVTYADGSIDHETGYERLRGILPKAGWQVRGRKVTYAPYR
ncbi:hypothetical protein ABZV93_25800 [Actinopolymorpha sp. NPDC004070]|uniref:hypothetical protein n=1 Tax=Actinopolymorpha sp. NPDC004070 TaxID=3154548 RepID=UPI0033B4C2FE